MAGRTCQKRVEPQSNRNLIRENKGGEINGELKWSQLFNAFAQGLFLFETNLSSVSVPHVQHSG
jgi:hypothetical protein